MAEELEKSWYTKHRPVTLEDYSGPALKGIISKRFIKRSNMPHVIMIHGNRGCGKTTLARILPKYYMCENPGPDGTPCEKCDMCVSINEIVINGDSMQVECPGVTEVDATIMNGKEAIQEVIDDAIQPPIYTPYKVLIMDEVHEISKAAQNSMLKIIEDIPPHLVVIMATTNPEKVLQTIKSRCQLMLEAKKQTVDDMAKRLEQISKMEGLDTSLEALKIIAEKGDRVPRECINLLESIAKTYDGEVKLETVKQYLGEHNTSVYIDYFKAANTSLGEILAVVDNIKESNIKYIDFVTGMLKFVLEAMYVKNGIRIEEYPVEQVEMLKGLFEMYEVNEFDLLLQVLENLHDKVDAGNDIKAEFMLVTTALRIGKIGLLAQGLADEQEEAIAENKLSLFEHSQKLKVRNTEIKEQLKLELSLEEMHEEFENVKTIKDTAGLLDSIQVPELSYEDDSQEQVKAKETVGEAVDNFFDDL